MGETEESEVAAGGLRLRPIKTKQGGGGGGSSSGRPDESESNPLPTISCLDGKWEDEPMTPAGRAFRTLNDNFVGLCLIGFKHPIDRRKFKAHMQSTLMKHKRFCSRVEMRKGRPWWTEVETNVDDHVLEADLTAAEHSQGSTDWIMDYTTDVVIPKPFDPSKPLWDIHLVDAKLGEGEGESCCIIRIHHAIGDGTSIMSLLMACTRSVEQPDMLPAAKGGKEVGRKLRVNRPSVVSRLSAAMSRFWLVFWCSLVEIGKVSATLMWMKDSSTVIQGSAEDGHTARKCRFVTVRGEEMRKASKLVPGATVNDVFVAMASIGLRRYLEHRAITDLAGEGSERSNEKEVKTAGSAGVGAGKKLGGDALTKKLDNLRIRGAALINTRAAPGLQELSEMMKGQASQAAWGNQMGYMLVPIPMNLSRDPLKLLREAQAIGTRKKSSLEGVFSYASAALVMRLFGEKATAALLTRITLSTTFSISNMKGPSEAVMFADNPLTGLIASASGHPHSLTLHLQSYNGEMAIIAMTAKRLIPDPEYLLRLCLEGLEEMKAAGAAAETAQNG